MAQRIHWSDDAKADIRAFDRITALRILNGLTRFISTGEGDVRALSGEFAGQLRLRLGDYRVIFTRSSEILHILRVRNRREAYR